jgi:hypothetical protein
LMASTIDLTNRIARAGLALALRKNLHNGGTGAFPFQGPIARAASSRAT